MSQSVVTIRLNGHPYQIGCGAGEEEHVANLGAEVESIMQSLVGSVGQIGEARLLAMVALILADRAGTAAAANGSSNAATPTAPSAGASADDGNAAEDRAAALLEDAAAKDCHADIKACI
jgi:cell division protein ZapA